MSPPSDTVDNMAISVADLLAQCELEHGGAVRWGDHLPEERPGVYFVTSSGDPFDAVGKIGEYIPSIDSLAQLKKLLPGVSVDGSPATERELAKRLGQFWIPDSSILYIGLAGTSLRRRVSQYYSTRIGARSPHSGGWWLKTLAQLDQLHVHYAATDDSKAMEQQLIYSFAMSVPIEQRHEVFDPERIAPFANVNTRPGLSKRHGLKNYKMPKTSHELLQNSPSEDWHHLPPEIELTIDAGQTTGEFLTVPSQRVSPNDLQTGVLRLPKSSEHAFPEEDTEFTIHFRDHKVVVIYRVRSGRSSTIGLGKALMGVVATANKPIFLQVRGTHATIIE